MLKSFHAKLAETRSLNGGTSEIICAMVAQTKKKE